MRIKTNNDVIVTDNLVDEVVIWTKDENTVYFHAKNLDSDEFKFDETIYINLQEVLAVHYIKKEAKEVKNNG